MFFFSFIIKFNNYLLYFIFITWLIFTNFHSFTFFLIFCFIFVLFFFLFIYLICLFLKSTINALQIIIYFQQQISVFSKKNSLKVIDINFHFISFILFYFDQLNRHKNHFTICSVWFTDDKWQDNQCQKQIIFEFYWKMIPLILLFAVLYTKVYTKTNNESFITINLFIYRYTFEFV